jgi:hypothetical protein
LLESGADISDIDKMIKLLRITMESPQIQRRFTEFDKPGMRVSAKNED